MNGRSKQTQSSLADYHEEGRMGDLRLKAKTKELEDLIQLFLRDYEEQYAKANPDIEIKFNFTITIHEMAVDNRLTAQHAAYARLEKATRPKAPDTLLDKTKWDEETDWERLLVYAQAYRFKDIAERTNPIQTWKFDLLMDCLRRLVTGGLEYAELLKRMQIMTKNKENAPIAEVVGAAPQEEKIIITDKMPEPLRNDEKEYLEWVKKNHKPEPK
jgi:hypothetical protein